MNDLATFLPFISGLGGALLGGGMAWGIAKTQIVSLRKDLEDSKRESSVAIAALNVRIDGLQKFKEETLGQLAKIIEQNVNLEAGIRELKALISSRSGRERRR